MTVLKQNKTVMNVSFQIMALDAAQFAPYLSMDKANLIRHKAKWLTADAEPGFPCRVSLQDASVDERVLLLTFNHHDVASPYRSSGPIPHIS